MGSETTDKIRALIETVLSGQSSGSGGEKYYRDEPILRTAAQMARHTPREFRQMRKVAKNFDLYTQSREMIFYTQAKLMEWFEDDFPERVEFFEYFPTYQSMTDQQLRCYFTWRARVRCGQIEQTSRSYVYVYIYELLNQIGVATPQEGYDKLYAFWQIYRELDDAIDRNVSRWLQDYTIYHGLDAVQLREESTDTAVVTLLHYDSRSPGEVCAALAELSSYRLENSRFFKQHPDDVAQVVYRVYRALSDYFARHRKNSLMEKLIGRTYSTSYAMFYQAVFYQQSVHPDTDYEINELTHVRCRDGRWVREQFYTHQRRSSEAGAILKEIDYQMRQAYHMSSTLKPGGATKLAAGIIEKELAAWLAEQKAAETARAARAVSIDVSKLQDIRQAALNTQSRLLVDDEDEPEIGPLPELPPVNALDVLLERQPVNASDVQSAAQPVVSPADELGLGGSEYRLLQCLLYGRPYADWVRAEGKLLSVLVDAINEQLYDRFADTVIEDNSGVPAVIEDYSEELKGVIEP